MVVSVNLLYKEVANHKHYVSFVSGRYILDDLALKEKAICTN